MATIVPGRTVTYDVEMPSQPSSRLCVECHVAQGSILGSILFIMYTAHLISVIKSRGLSPHITPMPTIGRSCCPAAVDALSSKISECVGAVASWMESNRLSLNCDSDKTEVVWCATSRQLSCSLSVDGTLVMPVRSAHDAYTKMRTHIQRTVLRCFAVLSQRQLRQIRHSVPTDTFQTLVVSWLWQQCPGWPPGLFGPATPLSAERGCAVYLRRSDHISDSLACLHPLATPAYAPLRESISRSPYWRIKSSTDLCQCTSAHLRVSPTTQSARRMIMTSQKTWHQQNHWPHFVAPSRHTCSKNLFLTTCWTWSTDCLRWTSSSSAA